MSDVTADVLRWRPVTRARAARLHALCALPSVSSSKRERGHSHLSDVCIWGACLEMLRGRGSLARLTVVVL